MGNVLLYLADRFITLLCKQILFLMIIYDAIYLVCTLPRV
jgi:hypothetical protein